MGKSGELLIQEGKVFGAKKFTKKKKRCKVKREKIIRGGSKWKLKEIEDEEEEEEDNERLIYKGVSNMKGE